jgi:hypothetical protein
MTRVAHIQPIAPGGKPPEGRPVVPAKAWEAADWKAPATSNRQFHSVLNTPSPVSLSTSSPSAAAEGDEVDATKERPEDNSLSVSIECGG